MTAKVFAIDTKPGIQRDGTVFDAEGYSDGRWVRFQRGRPRKIGGYRLISEQLTGPSRGMWMNPNDGINRVFSGYSGGLQELNIDNNGIGAGVTDFTLSDFTTSVNNMWQFDGFYASTGGVGAIVAHPGQNLAAIDSTIDTPVLSGNMTGTTMSQVGVFTAAGTTATSTTFTLTTADARIAAGQTITGTGIPAATTVVSIVGLVVTMSAAATSSSSITATFNNNVEVSGGCVTLHPYLFVYGNNGLIRNSSASDLTDWVSADANEVNVATTKIIQGLPVRGGSNSPAGLFWALDALIRVSYIGGVGTPPQYWRYDTISAQTSILSSQCAIEYGGIYYWIGADSFMLYNGVVKDITNTFNQNYFFDNLNYAQRQKVWATKVPRFGEIWWYYPRGDSTECNDAIIYNVREQVWYDAGTALGARRSAGFYSQVFHYPLTAAWDASVSTLISSGTYTTLVGSTRLYSDTYDVALYLDLLVLGSNIGTNATISQLTVSAIKTLGAITGGTLYTNGTYTNVALTGGGGFGALADVVVSGGSVTSVTFTTATNFRGYGYVVAGVLSCAAASIGGTGSGFSVAITAIYAQTITMSVAATASGSTSLTFYTQADLIGVYQNEIGVDAIEGQNLTAIESYFETNNLGLVTGGPSQPSMVGENVWLRLERIEPDFVQQGEMSVIVTGRPFAQSADTESSPYVFDPDTGKIDMREQRRELRLRFTSNVQGGDYQTGMILLNADIGDVRP